MQIFDKEIPGDFTTWIACDCRLYFRLRLHVINRLRDDHYLYSIIFSCFYFCCKSHQGIGSTTNYFFFQVVPIYILIEKHQLQKINMKLKNIKNKYLIEKTSPLSFHEEYIYIYLSIYLSIYIPKNKNCSNYFWFASFIYDAMQSITVFAKTIDLEWKQWLFQSISLKIRLHFFSFLFSFCKFSFRSLKQRFTIFTKTQLYNNKITIATTTTRCSLLELFLTA